MPISCFIILKENASETAGQDVEEQVLSKGGDDMSLLVIPFTICCRRRFWLPAKLGGSRRIDRGGSFSRRACVSVTHTCRWTRLPWTQKVERAGASLASMKHHVQEANTARGVGAMACGQWSTGKVKPNLDLRGWYLCPSGCSLLTPPPDLEQIPTWKIFHGYWPLSKAYRKGASHLAFFCFVSYYIRTQRAAKFNSGRVYFQFHIRSPLHLEWLFHLKSFKYALIQKFNHTEKVPYATWPFMSIPSYVSVIQWVKWTWDLSYMASRMWVIQDERWLRPFLHQMQKRILRENQRCSRAPWSFLHLIFSWSMLSLPWEMETCI